MYIHVLCRHKGHVLCRQKRPTSWMDSRHCHDDEMPCDIRQSRSPLHNKHPGCSQQQLQLTTLCLARLVCTIIHDNIAQHLSTTDTQTPTACHNGRGLYNLRLLKRALLCMPYGRANGPPAADPTCPYLHTTEIRAKLFQIIYIDIQIQ